VPDVLDAQQERVLRTLLAMQRQSWEQGVAGHALLDLGCRDLARSMATDAVVRQTARGKLAELDDDGVVNCAANGEAVHAAMQETPTQELEGALARQLSWIEDGGPRASDGTVFHLEGVREVWVDSVYMVVPFLVLCGHVEEAARQLDGHRNRLFDESTGLYRARWDEDRSTPAWPALWGTGNGWVAAGLARAVRHLGGRRNGAAHDAFREEVAAHARVVIDACLARRCDSGRFHDVLDDPSTFEEVNLGQMLGYAVLTGVTDGWLPSSYVDTGRSLVATARASVDPDGYVRPVCGAPDFDRPGTSAEAQAFFLLATAAERRHDPA
jgi:unsaturated rhamnogalacturonyl hydrolase